MLNLPFSPFIEKREKTRVKQITARQLQQELDRGESLLLLDVRSALEYKQGHIEGSRLLSLPNLAQRKRELPRDRTIVCVCRSGSRSMVACEQLARDGFDVINLRGGIMGWQADGLPLS